MKKKLLLILSIVILSTSISSAFAKTYVSSGLAEAIKLYKAKNYTQCYTELKTVIKNEPSNALAYYYMAITAVQIGNKTEAINNYQRAITLATPNSNLARYAEKGKTCLESPDKCMESVYSTDVENFINSKRREKLSDTAKGEYENLKIKNIMREMNRNNEIDPQKFKDYKDFSSFNPEGTPSNDEIVAALRTLQKAGLGSNVSELSLLTGTPTQQGSIYNMMGNSNISPQIMQALFSNNMSLGF